MISLQSLTISLHLHDLEEILAELKKIHCSESNINSSDNLCLKANSH